jgi:hypothetical protein
MLEKKPYVKPHVESQTIKLGVYGEYRSDPDLHPLPTPPTP